MPAKILDNQDPETKEYLAKIGEIVVLLNHLEAMVDFWIWELINADGNAGVKQQIGRRITSPLNFEQKVQLLRSLIVERYGEEKVREFKETMKLLMKCCETRNDIAHSQWFIQYGNKKEGIPSTTHKINIPKAMRPQQSFDFSKAIKDVDLSELDQSVTEINLAIEKLTIFFISSS
jgi:hypothetical protein